MPLRSPFYRAKWFIVAHFELLLVVLIVASLVFIQSVVDDRVGFLSFYYLPVILAGFYLGRRGGAYAAVLSVTLVAFFQMVVGLEDTPGLPLHIVLTLVPWAGFLVLTGYVVGYLADQRKARLTELTSAYLAMLELLVFHLESSERQSRGHSFRVAARATAIGEVLGMREDALEELRVAALLHELSPTDPRLTRLFEHFPGATRELPIAASMRAALDIVREYSGYYSHVGGDWPVDHLNLNLGTKVLAVADAFETLQVPTSTRPPFSEWAAIEEIERGKGVTFATEAVGALRQATEPGRVLQVRRA